MSTTNVSIATRLRTRLFAAGLTALLIGAGAIFALANLFQLSVLFGGDDEDHGPLGWLGILATLILAPIRRLQGYEEAPAWQAA